MYAPKLHEFCAFLRCIYIRLGLHQCKDVIIYLTVNVAHLPCMRKFYCIDFTINFKEIIFLEFFLRNLFLFSYRTVFEPPTFFCFSHNFQTIKFDFINLFNLQVDYSQVRALLNSNSQNGPVKINAQGFEVLFSSFLIVFLLYQWRIFIHVCGWFISISVQNKR